jgi:hypothetical protein
MNYQPETRKETLENSIQIHKKKEENTIEKTKNEIFKMF